MSLGHPVGKDDIHVWVTIRDVQLILASHVPRYRAIGCRDRWLHCLSGVAIIGIFMHDENHFAMIGMEEGSTGNNSL